MITFIVEMVLVLFNIEILSINSVRRSVRAKMPFFDQNRRRNVLTLSRIVLTSRRNVLTLSRIVLTFGRIVLTFGRNMLTFGSNILTSGRIGLT